MRCDKRSIWALVAIVPRCVCTAELLETGLDALERLALDQGSHLGQDPDQAAAFLVIEPARPHLW
jgi:hypothetical protein